MTEPIVIIGGGLAGLALSVDLSRRGYAVTVIEKGNYPRQKVCGEYISMESHRYLLSLCPALAAIDLPVITQFKLSSTGKKEFSTALDLGGFGVSRYLLEDLLYKEAQQAGAIFMLNTKASDIQYDQANERYAVKTSDGVINASLVCNSSGRKSNFEAKSKEDRNMGTNYVGVKYHVWLERDPKQIEIHNFPGGYCGISSIEEGKACLCYIVNSEKLKNVHNSIQQLEQQCLYQNSNLKQIFTEAEFIFKQPVTISGINFLIKDQATEHSFFLGDSAGSIAPITGNGMSMALRSASVLAGYVDDHFSKDTPRQELVSNYSKFWNRQFSARIRLSRHLQKLSENPGLANMTIGLFNVFPSLARGVIRQTHGRPF